MAGADVMSTRALNRALLERQMLLRRHAVTPREAIEHLVGLQAQAPRPPYVALWSRLAEFSPEVLGRMLVERQAVRATLMRGTIHLVTADDFLAIRPVMQPALERGVHTNATFGRHRLDGVDVDALLATAREALEQDPRTVAELREVLAPHWPRREPAALAQAVRGLLPVIHVPPRGVWGRSGPVALTTVEAWLGRSVAADGSREQLVLRYLAAFGPATVADVQTWSGLTGLSEVVEALRARLRVLRDERGRELVDLPDAPRPDPDTPAPVRFVAEFDNLTLSHADRVRVVDDDVRRTLASRNGMVPGTVLVDGFVRATWRVERTRTAATLHVQPCTPLNREEREAVDEEGGALLRWLAGDADRVEVQVA